MSEEGNYSRPVGWKGGTPMPAKRNRGSEGGRVAHEIMPTEPLWQLLRRRMAYLERDVVQTGSRQMEADARLCRQIINELHGRSQQTRMENTFG